MKEALLLAKWREVVLNNTVMETDMLVLSKMINLMGVVSGIVQLIRQKDKVNGKMVKD